jgi:membrane-anchored protein YejM (alkaline phosphatase superfamily)
LEPAPGVIDPNDDVTFERLQRAYAAAVRQFDGDVGTILEECEPGDCLIVMANRGQNLGEHGLVGDERPWLHEEIMHVPLIIRLPGGAAAGRRMSALTQPIDIGPTLLELFGLPRPEEWHGQSLLPLCRGGAGARLYVCAGDQIESISEYALQTADEKVIVPHGDSQRQPMYFVKPDDRWEVNSLRQSNLERAEALEGVLREYIAASRRPGPMIIPPLPEFIPAEPS